MLKVIDKPKAKSEFRNEVVTITPDLARQWLEKNIGNRQKKPRKIASYARDMRAGSWRLTGDPIRFDVNQRLIDGQNRLFACIDADTSFASVVLYGLPPEVQDYIDIGASRTGGDMLTLHGHTNATALSVALRVLMRIRDGIDSHVGYSNPELKACADKHPHLPLYVPNGGAFPRGIPSQHVGVLAYLASTYLDKGERGQAMVRVLKTGVPDYQGDPMHLFRERILRTSGDDDRLTRDVKWHLLKRAWNAFAEQKPVGQLQYKGEVEIEGLDPSVL